MLFTVIGIYLDNDQAFAEHIEENTAAEAYVKACSIIEAPIMITSVIAGAHEVYLP